MKLTIKDIASEHKTHGETDRQQSKKLLDKGIKGCDNCNAMNPFESLQCKYCKNQIVIS